MGLNIDTGDIIDAALDLASNEAERGLEKSVDTPLTHIDRLDQKDMPEIAPLTPQPQPNTFQKIDNLGQDLYGAYGHFRDNLEEGDYLHATRNAFNIGNDVIGGDIGRTMRIGKDLIDAYDAIKDGDYGRALRLGLNVIKNGATIAIGSFNLSPKEQMLYDRATCGLNNIAQAERIDQKIKDNLDKNIEEARLMAQYPHQPTRLELANEKINEMRRQELQQTMRQDAATMPTPEQYAEQNYSFGQTPTPEQIAAQNDAAIPLPNTEENVNMVAMADTKNNQTPQSLTPAQLAWINSHGR